MSNFGSRIARVFCPQETTCEDFYRVDYVKEVGVLGIQVLVLLTVSLFLFWISGMFLATFFFISFSIYLRFARREFLELRIVDNILVIENSDNLKRINMREVNLDSIVTICYNDGKDLELGLQDGLTIRIKTDFPSLPFIFHIFRKGNNICRFINTKRNRNHKK